MAALCVPREKKNPDRSPSLDTFKEGGQKTCEARTDSSLPPSGGACVTATKTTNTNE